MNYSILIERAAQKSLAKIPNPYQNKIIKIISTLKKTPRPSNVKKLSGRNAWRIRVGTYRIIYEINDTTKEILVVLIGHRKEIYKILI